MKIFVTETDLHGEHGAAGRGEPLVAAAAHASHLAARHHGPAVAQRRPLEGRHGGAQHGDVEERAAEVAGAEVGEVRRGPEHGALGPRPDGQVVRCRLALHILVTKVQGHSSLFQQFVFLAVFSFLPPLQQVLQGILITNEVTDAMG